MLSRWGWEQSGLLVLLQAAQSYWNYDFDKTDWSGRHGPDDVLQHTFAFYFMHKIMMSVLCLQLAHAAPFHPAKLIFFISRSPNTQKPKPKQSINNRNVRTTAHLKAIFLRFLFSYPKVFVLFCCGTKFVFHSWCKRVYRVVCLLLWICI